MSLAGRCCSIKSESVYKRVKSDRHAETLTFKGETLPLKKKKKIFPYAREKKKISLKTTTTTNGAGEEEEEKKTFHFLCVFVNRERVCGIGGTAHWKAA